MPGPPEGIPPDIYLVSNDAYDPSRPPFHYEIFNRHRHIYPDVFWFQPYSKNPSAINHTLTLGLLIESGDLDGVTIPIPNIWMSLTENNSMYFQGLIPSSYTRRYIPGSTETDRFRLCSRALNGDEYLYYHFVTCYKLIT